MRYTDEQRIEQIRKYCKMLMQFIDEVQVDEQKLLCDYKIQWAITTPLYNIGEHAYALSKSYKEQHDSIPWNIIASLRHRLVHHYEDTNWIIIADVVFKEIPDLIEKLNSISEQQNVDDPTVKSKAKQMAQWAESAVEKSAARQEQYMNKPIL